MKDRNRGRAIVVGCAVLICAGAVFAQDWPQWRGANRDGKAGGFTAPEKWPQQLTQKWKTPVGAGDSTPALVGDRLYVFSRQGEEEVISCLNAADGKEIWKEKYAAQTISGPSAKLHSGPRSSPAVAEGKVVTLGVGGVVSCVDAASGKLLWRKDPFPKAAPRFFTSMSPIIVDGMAIVHVGGQGNGAIIAFVLATGDEKWRWGGEGPDYGSPALLTVGGVKQIVTPTEKSIVGIALADGKLLWQRPFPLQGMAYNAATPIVDGQTVIYTGKGRGAKAVKIEKKGDGFEATELWSNPDLAPQFASPVLRDGMLFGLSDKGNLYCLDAKTGKTAWTDTTARDRQGFTSIVDGGSCLLALPSNGEMVVFKPDGKQYQEVAKIKVSDTTVYAHPVLAGGRVFVKDQESVTMLTVQ